MPSSLSVADVFIACASDPEPGSVRQNAATSSPVAHRGRYLSFCASLPNRTIPLQPID